jgi:hypothetical protein
MSRGQRRSFATALALLVAVGGGWAVIGSVRQDDAGPVPGDPTPNPTLHLRAGERVRLTLVNLDVGVPHDLAAPELELAIPPVVVEGASASTVFSAPPTRGRYEYTCTLHQQMMRGIIQVGG